MNDTETMLDKAEEIIQDCFNLAHQFMKLPENVHLTYLLPDKENPNEDEDQKAWAIRNDDGQFYLVFEKNFVQEAMEEGRTDKIAFWAFRALRRLFQMHAFLIRDEQNKMIASQDDFDEWGDSYLTNYLNDSPDEPPVEIRGFEMDADTYAFILTNLWNPRLPASSFDWLGNKLELIVMKAQEYTQLRPEFAPYFQRRSRKKREKITKVSLANPKTYVAEKKPGRNDPCPCGSGKKYKKCCGRKDVFND